MPDLPRLLLISSRRLAALLGILVSYEAGQRSTTKSLCRLFQEMRYEITRLMFTFVKGLGTTLTRVQFDDSSVFFISYTTLIKP